MGGGKFTPPGEKRPASLKNVPKFNKNDLLATRIYPTHNPPAPHPSPVLRCTYCRHFYNADGAIFIVSDHNLLKCAHAL